MPARPMLAPGTAIYRRSGARLQIGLDPGLVIPDAPGLEEVLRRMDGITTRHQLEQAISRVSDTDPRQLLALLASAGLLSTDATTPAGTPRTSLSIRTCGPITRFADTLAALLTESGITVGSDEERQHVVLVSDGEPDRGTLERLRLDRTAHTAVSVLATHVRWGPAIIDPADPCWGCVDASFTDLDPAWPALTTQFGRRTPTPAHQGLTPAHLQVALGLVTRDLVQVATAPRTPLVGRLAILRADLTVGHLPVPPHPECGCGLLPLPPSRLS